MCCTSPRLFPDTSTDAHFGQRHPALAIHHPNQTLRHRAPEFDAQAVSRSKDILRAHRHVHREPVEVSRAIAEDVCPKAFEHCRTARVLRVQVIERGNVGVGIGLMMKRRLRRPTLERAGGRNLPRRRRGQPGLLRVLLLTARLQIIGRVRGRG